MKTVKQIADEFGVSKQAITKRLSQLPPTEVTTNEKGVRFISPSGEGILEKLMLRTNNRLPLTEPTTNNGLPPTDGSEIYRALRAEIGAQSEQLEKTMLHIDNRLPPTKPTTDNWLPPTDENEIYKMLKTELNAKNEQLAEKDRQIEKLTDTIRVQAQSINADRHNELAGTLQMQLVDGVNIKPKGRWGRLKEAWRGDHKV